MDEDVDLAKSRVTSPALYLYLPVLTGRTIGKLWCPILESRYLSSQRMQVGCSPYYAK